jgi:hypothetical protein
MKIVRFPEGTSAEDIELLQDKFKEEYPNEHILFISDAIDIVDLSLKDLYRVRNMIDEEISDREMMAPNERNKS